MKLFLFLVFSFFLLCVSPAACDTIRINLVNNQALDPDEFITFSRDLRRYLRANISPKLRITRLEGNVLPPTSLKADTRILGILTPKLVHYLFPPTNGFVYGWSYTCSYLSAVIR